MIGCILTAVCLCFGMASCSEDDGDGDGDGSSSVGKNSAKLGNETFKVPYGYWHNSAEDSEASAIGDNVILLEFYSYNPTSSKFPGKASVVGIEYDVPEGQKEITSTVLKSGEYRVFVGHNLTMNENEGIYCESKFNSTNDPDMKIVRDGSKYTITVEGLKVSDENDENVYNFSFNYSGKLTHRQIAE